MVKIERLQEWAASDKCLSVFCNGETSFYKFIRNCFNKLNTIIVYCKMAQFLINNMYFLFYKIY